MRLVFSAAFLGALGLSFAADAATIRLRLTVPTICVAKTVEQSESAINLATFCNSARGGTVYAVGSIDGSAIVLNVEGRQVRINPGERTEVFSSDGPFRDQLFVRVQSGAGVNPVALLFQAVPN